MCGYVSTYGTKKEKEMTNIELALKATTKNATQLAGSNTLYFENDQVFAYNGLMAVKTVTDIPITGSIDAQKFGTLLSRITVEDSVFIDEDSLVLVKYGRNKASFRKQENALELYKKVVFPNGLMKTVLPTDFLEMWGLIKFQNHKKAVSGVYVDDDTAYMLNARDIGVYKVASPFGTSFWLPREACETIIGLQGLTHYALSQGFLYVYTDDAIIGFKLRIGTEYRLDVINQVLAPKTDFSHKIVIDNTQAVIDAINRVQISTSVNTDQHQVFSLRTGKDLTISSISGDKITEHVDYVGENVKDNIYTIPVDMFLKCLKAGEGTMYLLEDKIGCFICCRNDVSSLFIKILRK